MYKCSWLVHHVLKCNVVQLIYLLLGYVKCNTQWCMFSPATVFNQYLSRWDVRNVTETTGMFWHATSFHQQTAWWGHGWDWDLATCEPEG
jgi:hypothetical protein